MRAIFAEAVDEDFLAKDPARMVKPPAKLREVDKTTLTWDQLRAALDKLDELSLRDWILMKIDMSNALRPSELFYSDGAASSKKHVAWIFRRRSTRARFALMERPGGVSLRFRSLTSWRTNRGIPRGMQEERKEHHS